MYQRIPLNRRFLPLNIIAVGIFAGAAGNLIDRVIHHYVIDFFYFSLINFPIFNVADIYVTLSAVALIIAVLFYYKEEDFSLIFTENCKMKRSPKTVQEESFEVQYTQEGERLDKVLSKFISFSRSFFQKLIKNKQIQVNGAVQKAELSGTYRRSHTCHHSGCCRNDH